MQQDFSNGPPPLCAFDENSSWYYITYCLVYTLAWVVGIVVLAIYAIPKAVVTLRDGRSHNRANPYKTPGDVEMV